MSKDSAKYTFFFALAICLVCSILLSLVSEGLRDKKEVNVQMDIKKNILKAVKLKDPLPEKPTAQQVLDMFDQKIEGVVIDINGDTVDDVKAEDLTASRLKEYIKDGVVSDDQKLLPIFIYKEGGQVYAFCIPVIGKGLWSTLYGYFAIEPDASTVRGITFYAHGETPGLGAEIEQEWFQTNFEGKKIWDLKNAELKPIEVIKGKVADRIPNADEAQYYVDGISGATITANGVTDMLDKWLNFYEPYFGKIRKAFDKRANVNL